MWPENAWIIPVNCLKRYYRMQEKDFKIFPEGSMQGVSSAPVLAWSPLFISWIRPCFSTGSRCNGIKSRPSRHAVILPSADFMIFSNANAKQRMSRAEINLQSQLYFDHWTQANLRWNLHMCAHTESSMPFHPTGHGRRARYPVRGPINENGRFTQKRYFSCSNGLLVMDFFRTVQSKLAIKSWHKGGRWSLQLRGQLPKAWSFWKYRPFSKFMQTGPKRG